MTRIDRRRPRWLAACLLGVWMALECGDLSVWAWGARGHATIGKLAQERLKPAAAKAVAELLEPDETLETIASWADEVRRSRPETERWHYVDIDIHETNYDPARDCEKTPKGDCVIAAIERCKAILVDPSKPRAERAEALKFLVHFIGDMHQPLHCADNKDRGGNDVKVTFFDQPSNLHRLWDSGIIEKNREPFFVYLRKLKTKMTGMDVRKIERGTTIDWALEGQGVAVTDVYGKLPADRVITGDYLKATAPVVDRQLIRASVRLARVLNDLFALPVKTGRQRK